MVLSPQGSKPWNRVTENGNFLVSEQSLPQTTETLLVLIMALNVVIQLVAVTVTLSP